MILMAIGRLKILYGTETGNAEDFAQQLWRLCSRANVRAECLAIDDFGIQDLCDEKFVIFIVSTTGQGEMPANMRNAWRFLLSKKLPERTWLGNLKFVLLGLGDSSYQKYNFAGKKLYRRLLQLGAHPILDMALADEQHPLGIEHSFEEWSELLFKQDWQKQFQIASNSPHVLNNFCMESNKENGAEDSKPSTSGERELSWHERFLAALLDRQYQLEILTQPNGPLFTGEFGRVGAFQEQKPPFDQRNPFCASVLVNRELHSAKSDRSCRHVEFSVDCTNVSYEAGDHVAIFPTNDSELVERIGQLLGIDLDTVFRLVNMDEESTKKHPFPCPCTYRTAVKLTHYVDICTPLKFRVLRVLTEFASDEASKARLTLLGTASEEGVSSYSTFITKERRNIVDVLSHFPDCKPPLDLLLEILPRLQARYYSISSSPKGDNGQLAVTAVVLRYNVGARLVKGVCTNYLAGLSKESTVPLFIRKSTFRLPTLPQTPVIMIGPGTGLAPFRGFLQERSWQKQQGEQIGEMHLYFGCRRPEHDHIYKEELKEFVKAGVLTELHVAYSRMQAQKVYVQHKLWENCERVWALVKQGAAVFVCGDARNMATDVQKVFLQIFKETGRLDNEASQKLLKDMERLRLYQEDVWS